MISWPLGSGGLAAAAGNAGERYLVANGFAKGRK